MYGGNATSDHRASTMEFITRSLRAWAAPLVLPIPRASAVFGEEGSMRDTHVADQLRSLGREVARAARQMTLHGSCDWSDNRDAAHPALTTL